MRGSKKHRKAVKADVAGVGKGRFYDERWRSSREREEVAAPQKTTLFVSEKVQDTADRKMVKIAHPKEG